MHGWEDAFDSPPIYHKLFHLTPDTPFSQLMQAIVDYFRSLEIDPEEIDSTEYGEYGDQLPEMVFGNGHKWINCCCHEYMAYIKPKETPRSLCFAGLADNLVYGSSAHASYDASHADKGWTCKGNGWRTEGVGFVTSFGPVVSQEALGAEPTLSPTN